jgi:hypothetical protein
MYSKPLTTKRGSEERAKANAQRAEQATRVFGVTPEPTPMERTGWAVPAELHKRKLHPGDACPGCKVARQVEAQLREAIKEERLACAQVADDIAIEYESEASVWIAEKIRERVTGL